MPDYTNATVDNLMDEIAHLTLNMNRDGCSRTAQEEYAVRLEQVRAEILKRTATTTDRFTDDAPMSEDKTIKLEGKPFRCSCGANVFKSFINHPSYYRCNGCGTIFEGA